VIGIIGKCAQHIDGCAYASSLLETGSDAHILLSMIVYILLRMKEN